MPRDAKVRRPRWTGRLLVLAVCCITCLTARAQETGLPAQANEGANPYGSGVGLEILLTNNGFGLGGYYHRAISRSGSFMGALSLGAGKDEQELKFFRFGTSFIPNKANYLLMMPVQAGFSYRLFQDTIEDNFRPFAQITAGPTLGWEYPYFDDENGNRSLDDDEDTYDAFSALPKGAFRPGVGGTVAIGAHFGLSKRVTQGVRIGYAFTYFFEGIQLLEPDVQGAQRYFGTPSISLIFGKVL